MQTLRVVAMVAAKVGDEAHREPDRERILEETRARVRKRPTA
jgi:hypothetical protein